jgi:hypothetical protein
VSYTVGTLINVDLAGFIHGQNTNAIQNVYGVINRAGRKLLLDCDPYETKRASQIAGTVFNSVWDYPVPVDLKGQRIIDLYPQVNRYPKDVWAQVYNQNFDSNKNTPWSGDMFTVLNNSGLKTIRINAPFLTAPITIDPCNNIPGTGTYTAGGGATTPVVDNVNYVTNNGSLNFNLLAGHTTGNIAAVLTTPIDLTTHLNQSTLFLYTYLPTPASVTAVTLQWGSSSSNYWSVTTSLTQQNTAFQTGWNLLPFQWLGASVTGSPVVSKISYYNVIYTYNSTLQTAVRLDDVNSNLGSILNIEYYSKYLFSSAAGVFQETTTQSSDLINLDTDSYNLLIFLVGYFAAQQQQGLDALFYDSNFFLQQYTEALQKYKAQYKSEIQLPQTSYYKPKKAGYSRYLSRRWS